MSRIYWDTMLFVYWLEDHPTFGPRIGQIHSRMRERQDELCTSAFTVGEILTGPYKKDSTQGVERVRQFFRMPWLRILPFTQGTANHYGYIRAEFGISPADTIHLASAAEARVDLFLTNDSRLIGKYVPGIGFIVGLNTELL